MQEPTNIFIYGPESCKRNILCFESCKGRVVSLFLKVNFTLEQAMKAQRGSTGIALLFFFNLGARWGWVVNATPRPLYPPGMTLYPL
jgi:hypothetical protein